jgi:hypothetical protein
VWYSGGQAIDAESEPKSKSEFKSKSKRRGKAVERKKPCHLLVASVRHMGGCNGTASMILTPRTSMQGNSKFRRGRGSSRGEEVMSHAGHKHQVLEQPQWHCQHDPDVKEVNMMQF